MSLENCYSRFYQSSGRWQENVNEPYSINRGLDTSAKSIDSCQPASTAKADINRNSLLQVCIFSPSLKTVIRRLSSRNLEESVFKIDLSLESLGTSICITEML